MTQIGNIETEETTTWDDILNIYKVLSSGIIDLAKSINSTIETYNKEIKTELTENEIKTLSSMLEIFKKDVENISKEIGKVYIVHKDKSGEMTDETDLFDAINIQQKYISIKEVFFTVINPTYLNILELVSMAVDRHTKKEASDSNSVKETEKNEEIKEDINGTK